MVRADRKDLNSNKTKKNITISPTTDPSVSPHHTSSSIPQRPTCYGSGGRRRPGQRWPASGCPPDSRRPPPAGGCVPRGRGFWLRPGDIHFSQDHLSPPLSYIPQPCNGPNGPKGIHSYKKTLRPSLISSHLHSVITRHPSSALCPPVLARLLPSADTAGGSVMTACTEDTPRPERPSGAATSGQLMTSLDRGGGRRPAGEGRPRVERWRESSAQSQVME